MSDKKEAVYRKSGRSARFKQHRGSSSSSLSSARRVNPTPVNSTEANSAVANCTIQKCTHVQPQLHGEPDASLTTKPSESSAAQRSSRVVPKAFTSQPMPPMSSDSVAPTTPAKGDMSKVSPFQFGSISPDFMDGVIGRAVHHDSFRSVPSGPTPPVLKQQQPPRKDAAVTDESNSLEAHVGIKGGKDPQVSASTPTDLIQKPSVVPVTGISMPMPYHQSQAPLQFSGHNPHIQSQSMSTASLHMPVPIPITIGNAAQVQQQVFVPGLQSHPMHHQGIMHQGQNMSFTPATSHQLSHQLGNMGIGIIPQYPQQQGGKFATPRKTTTLKITHPETHEELRLVRKADDYLDGGISGVRSHLNMPSQSQPVQSLAASHPSSAASCDTSSFVPQNGSETCTENSSQQSELANNSSVLCSLPKQSSASVAVSAEKLTAAPLTLPSSTTSEDSISVVSNNECRRNEYLSRSNSLKAKPWKKGQLQHQVSVKSPTEANVSSRAVDSGISDTGVSEPTGTEKNNSVAVNAEVLPSSLDTISAISCSIPSAVDVKTNCSADVSACVSAEGSDVQGADILNNHKQCTDLPEDFEISTDIATALMSANISSVHVSEHDSHPSPGRIVDKPAGMSRMDRLGSGMTEEDRWNKVCGAFHSGRGLDGIGGNAGFRAGQGGNFGVLRNPRAETPLQYAGGVLSGPMQSMGNQGGMLRNSSDGERWHCSSSFQRRCLTPSTTTPQTPLQMMRKAEKNYEVGKILDVEHAKQRQLKGILKKLTPHNFERLFEQVKAINIDNAVTLTGFISQIFEKALIEPTFCEMYANFCLHLASELPDFSEDNEKITFKRLLLNKCQEEFERGERDEEEANKADEGEVQQFDEEREERRVKARRRMLGNIRLIGELYKKRMLTERIMHECIKKLLGQYQDPDEEDIEALCILMSTIGEMIDHPKAKVHIDAYFERMMVLSNNMNLSSRVRFILKDAIDLRKNKWQQSRKVEGPKKIEEVRRDALQERQAQAQAGRMGRGLGYNPTAQMGGIRGYGSQDSHFEERQSYEARTLSVPLPQRILGDDSITLGPRGGLARGMSIRGSTVISSSSISDRFPVPVDSHRMATGVNGYSNLPECSPYSSREAIDKRVVQRVHQYIARFWYQAGLPFNLVKLDSFREMLEAIGKFGPHLPTPSYHAIRVPLLDMEVKYTEDLMKDHKVQRERFGCSIMSDAWTDKKQRSIINFLVNSTAGTMFIKSVDGSDFVKTGEKIFELLDAVVEEIGEGNVMQVITDNGSNYVLAGKMLESKRPKIYWTPCAAHCMDLMLEDIGKLPRIKMTIKRAISLVGFIYGHSSTLSLMRHFTKKRELVKHAVTRFATSFLSLERLYEKKGNLRKMFVSYEWTANKLSKEVKGREATKIVLMPSFWKNVAYTMKVMGPLVKVLRLVDSEKKAAMGYIYEAMDKAKEAIMKAFNEKENKYNDVYKIIDDRWTCQLHRPLHAAGYMLNPEYYYANQSMEFDPKVIGGMHACLHKFAPDTHTEFLMLKEMQVYKDASGMFGTSTAIAMRTEMAPAVWWRTFGSSAPNLQQIAIRILSLACSASRCERNWSFFEQIHSKKRNKLDIKRMHDLVYVKYNQALKRRYNIKDEVDPISLNEIDECNEWLVGEMDSDDEGGNERVFEEDDDLECDVVYRASGIGEPRLNTRPQKTKNPVLICSRGKAKKPKSSASSFERGKEKVVEEVDEEMEFDESEEEVEAFECDESDEEEIEGYVAEYAAEEDDVEDDVEDDITHLIL